MAAFTIQIAGHTAFVTSLFASTKDYCARYLSSEAPEFTITVTREDLEQEQQALLEEACREGIRPRVFTDPFLDRSVVQKKLAAALLAHGILLLHGSAVAVDGQGYLFTADCGTGKSTHVRFWREVFGDRAVMINDDKPFVRLTGEGALLCGAPWSGKHGLDTNITLPLKGICILHRGAENRIEAIKPEDALSMLKKQCNAHDSPLVDKLAETVPLWQMECTKERVAAEVSYAAMSRSLYNAGISI